MTSLICLSGGLDSALVLAARVRVVKCVAIGFDYGQRHIIELARAKAIADHYGVKFDVMEIAPLPRIDGVIVAGRNLALAGSAISIAAANGYDSVEFGCNASDWERFPDCRPFFWKSVRDAASAYGVRVSTPLLHTSKAEILRQAKILGVPIGLTWSCYDPNGETPCGVCLACQTRKDAEK